MRFVYIISPDSIEIEIQQYRDRLSPFIRTKSKISNLEKKLKLKSDINIYIYLTLLKSLTPPFKINKKYITKEVINEITNSSFYFERNNRNSSLKKITKVPEWVAVLLNERKSTTASLEFDKIKVYIENILNNKYFINIFVGSSRYSIEIPTDYMLSIPLIEEGNTTSINTDSVYLLKEKFKKWSGKSISTKYLSFQELKSLCSHNEVDVKYISNNVKKSISFTSSSLFKIDVYKDINLSEDEVKFYSDVLTGYLNNKKYIEYNESIFLIEKQVNDDFIENIDQKILQKLFSNDLANNNFIKKISSLVDIFNITDVDEKLRGVDFKAVLKAYQKKGVSWIVNLYMNNIEGCLLADEMGLGKTIQVIAFLLITTPKKILIIAPASLLHNWECEFDKFTNHYNNEISLSISESKTISIVSYEFARSKIDTLKKISYDVVILDESQKIKNINTQTFNAIQNINRKFTIIMTGTPVENSLNDLWTMLYAVKPELHSLYTSKINKLLLEKESYSRAIHLTIKLLHPIIMQRNKNDVLNLPSRKDQTILIDFTKNEKIKYDKLVHIFASSLSSGLSGRIQSIALEGLLRLRQFCSIHNSIPDSLINTYGLEDSKLIYVNEVIQSCILKNEKIVIFSQFTKTLDAIEELFNKEQYRYVRLDGSTSKQKRKEKIDQFQNDIQCHIFLISLKAGGVGLNLTSARNALLFEPWWNPAVEEQAFARIDRIGQLHCTKIYRLIYKDSIEEKIDTILTSKKEILTNITSTLIDVKSIQSEISKEIFNF